MIAIDNLMDGSLRVAGKTNFNGIGLTGYPVNGTGYKMMNIHPFLLTISCKLSLDVKK